MYSRRRLANVSAASGGRNKLEMGLENAQMKLSELSETYPPKNDNSLRNECSSECSRDETFINFGWFMNNP
jgi:hypothetical protein